MWLKPSQSRLFLADEMSKKNATKKNVNNNNNKTSKT